MNNPALRSSKSGPLATRQGPNPILSFFVAKGPLWEQQAAFCFSSKIDPELEENFNNIGESIYSHLGLTDASSEGPL